MIKPINVAWGYVFTCADWFLVTLDTGSVRWVPVFKAPAHHKEKKAGRQDAVVPVALPAGSVSSAGEALGHQLGLLSSHAGLCDGKPMSWYSLAGLTPFSLFPLPGKSSQKCIPWDSKMACRYFCKLSFISTF